MSRVKTNDTKLPPGCACHDCQASARCAALLDHEGHETDCDWSPSAFYPSLTIRLCQACGQRPATVCDQCQAVIEETTGLAYAEAAAGTGAKCPLSQAECHSTVITLLDALASIEAWLHDLFGQAPSYQPAEVMRPIADAIECGIQALPAGTWIRPSSNTTREKLGAG